MNISNIDSPEDKQTKNKKKRWIIIGVAVGIIILAVAIVITVVLINKSHKTKHNSGKDSDGNNEDQPIYVNISYNQDELKFFNIEKNISSTINPEGNKKENNNTFYYVCALGIRNKTETKNINDTYYEGFFAILSQFQYNETTEENDLILDNSELVNIINKKNDSVLLQDLQKKFISSNLFRNKLSKKEEYSEIIEKVDFEEEQVKPFLKLEFYKNGSYRNIYRPFNLSQQRFSEMKEFLDIIIPKISNETFKTVEEKKKEHIKAKLALLSQKRDKKIFKIRRRLNEGEKEKEKGVEVKDINSNDTYYLEPNYENSSNLIENEEELKTNRKKPSIKKMDNNETQFNNSQDSAVYSDFTKFRGSNVTKDISTLLDSNNTVKEIFFKSRMKLLKQEYLRKTDDETYDSNNYLEERNLLINESEINVTDPNTTLNDTEEEENKNSTEVVYNMNDAESIYSIINEHIKINCTYYNRELIKDIYDNYLDSFTYENDNNSTLKMLRSLQNILPIKDIYQYEIIELNEKMRNLEEDEEENKYFYGLKKSSYRKNVFQTDFLGLDIALGIVDTYIPSKGQSKVYFKMDLGDFKISHEIKSFKTNQPIIIENIQQMSFKLLQMMYLTHKNFEDRNKLYKAKIGNIIKNLLENDKINIVIDDSFTKMEEYYSFISNCGNSLKNQIEYLKDNFTKINKNSKENTNSNMFTLSQNILENYFKNYIINITKQINNSYEEIKEIIKEINDEVKNKAELIQPFLLEDINSLIKQIKNYINEDLEKSILKQLNEGKIYYNSEIKEKINKITNLNKFNILENIIQNNTIFNSLFSKEKKNYIASNITNIKNMFIFNITPSLNSLLNMFDNSLKKTNINKISLLLPDTKNISNILTKNSIEDDIDEYFSFIDKIDENINDIIIKIIKNYTNLLYNETKAKTNLISNKTLNTTNKLIEIGKNIKNYLIEIKKEKNKNIKDFHSEYFENYIYKFYNLTNLKNEYILNENSKNYSSFEREFINSVINQMLYWGTYTINYNFKLAYQLLNDAKYYVEDCLDECADNKKSFFGWFVNLFRDCDCEYYINIDLINNLQYMSKNSYQFVIDYFNSTDFISFVEQYFYSFETIFTKPNIILDQKIANITDFSYLKDIEKTIDFNFTVIKEDIINEQLKYLEEYGKNESDKFFKDFNQFYQNKEGIVFNKNYDIKIEDYIFSSSKYNCPHRTNYLKIGDSKGYINTNLKNDAKKLTDIYFEKLSEYNDFYKNYYQDLLQGINNKSGSDKYLVKLNYMIENYNYEIKQYLEEITNITFFDNLIYEYENIIKNNIFSDKTEYLKELIDKFTLKYINTSYLNNDEIQFMKEKIDFMEYINYTKEVSINSYRNYIRHLIINKIKIIYDLNKNILDYLILYEDEIENETKIIKNRLNETETIIKDYEIKFKPIMKSTNFYYINYFKDIDTSLFGKKLFPINKDNDNKISKHMKEIKINREVDRLRKIVNQIKLSMDIENNLFFSINKNNVDFYYEQIRLNITKESEKILDDYAIPQTNEILKEYSLEIFKEINKTNNNSKSINKILKSINDIIPIIDGNISSEVETDLNILYNDLFNLIGELISLNYEEKEINLEKETDIYYNRILDYLNVKNGEEIDNIEYNNKNEDIIKEISLIFYKRMKEKNINNYKLYFNRLFDKYENLKQENNFVSKVSELFEEYKKEELINSYFNIYKIILNYQFDSSDFNKNKNSRDEIKKIVINSYKNNFNEFKNNFVHGKKNKIKNGELIKLIEKNIDNILSEIKSIIEKSYRYTLDINNDKYYLKKHLINILETKINLNEEVDEQISKYIENNIIKMKYVKKIKEDLYSPKIKDIIIENFNNSLENYYFAYYKYEINYKMNLLNNYYYNSIIDFSQQFIYNQMDYIKYLLIQNNNFSNNTRQKISKLPEILADVFYKQIIHNNEIYSNISFIQNKNTLIKAYMNKIFDNIFMSVTFLTNKFKNSFFYNDKIYELFENYTTKLIEEVSFNDLNLYFSTGIYNLSAIDNVYNKIKSSAKIISSFSPLSPDKNNIILSNLFDKLNNSYNKLEIEQKLNFDKYLFDSMTEELDKYYRVNILEKAIKIYSNFTGYFNLKFKEKIKDKINSLQQSAGSYHDIYLIAEEIRNIIKNYSNESLNEIEKYSDKLKVFGMIDGLINIPIERIDTFRSLWDISPNQLTRRNLEHPKKKKIDFTKIIEYYNREDKKYKKQILSKMEKIMNQHPSMRNLEEYSGGNLFNSSCEPLSFNNISNMISNLIDDISNFQNDLDNENNFVKFKSKYEWLKLNSDNNKKLTEINTKLLLDELSDFSFFSSDNYDYLFELNNFMKYNKSERILLKEELNLINSVKNIKFFEKYKETLISIITSIYNFHSNLINVQTKTITVEDQRKYNYYISNNNDIDIILKFIKLNNIFTYSLYLINNKLESFIIDVKFTAFQNIEEFSSGFLYSEENEIDLGYEDEDDKKKENKKNKDKEEDDDDPIGDLILGYEFDNKYLGVYSCYSIDVISLIMKAITGKIEDEYSIKFPCATFPPLQLRVYPKLNIDTCLKIDYRYFDENYYPASKLTIDFNTGVQLGIKVEGGIYLDIKLVSASVAVGVDGTVYEGKIGLELTFDFNEARINFKIYMNYYGVSFEFYIKFSIKILFWKKTKKFGYKLKYSGSVSIIELAFDLYDKRQPQLLDN